MRVIEEKLLERKSNLCNNVFCRSHSAGKDEEDTVGQQKRVIDLFGNHINQCESTSRHDAVVRALAEILITRG